SFCYFRSVHAFCRQAGAHCKGGHRETRDQNGRYLGTSHADGAQEEQRFHLSQEKLYSEDEEYEEQPAIESAVCACGYGKQGDKCCVDETHEQETRRQQ